MNERVRDREREEYFGWGGSTSSDNWKQRERQRLRRLVQSDRGAQMALVSLEHPKKLSSRRDSRQDVRREITDESVTLEHRERLTTWSWPGKQDAKPWAITSSVTRMHRARSTDSNPSRLITISFRSSWSCSSFRFSFVLSSWSMDDRFPARWWKSRRRADADTFVHRDKDKCLRHVQVRVIVSIPWSVMVVAPEIVVDNRVIWLNALFHTWEIKMQRWWMNEQRHSLVC